MNLTTTIYLPSATLNQASKNALTTYADALVATYYEEGHDMLSLLAEAAKLELLASRIKQQAKEKAVDEVSRFGREGVSKLGVMMTVRAVSVEYDYSLDPVWQELNQAVEDAKARRKEQEELLRKLPYEGRVMVNEFTGEFYKAYPPAKKSTDGVALTIG